MLLTVLLLVCGVPALASSDEKRPDLVVKELEVEPTRDGFRIHLAIGNTGDAPAGPTNTLVMDKVPGVPTEPEVISKVTMGDLHQGESFEKDINWIPYRAGTHLIYVALDAGTIEEEASESNNIRTVEVSLPVLEEVSSSFDGVADPDVLGTFISGIENEVEIRMRYAGASAPSFLRSHIRIDNGSRVYATNLDDGRLIARIEMKDIGPGDHHLTINTTYCGVALPTSKLLIKAAPMPSWTSGLISRESYFDEELHCYSISGRLDIPTLDYVPRFGGDTPKGTLSIGGTNGELLVRSFILADGTTTFRSTLDLPVTAGDQRYTVSSSGKAFSPDPEGPFSLSSSCSENVEMDLRGFMMGRGIHVEGPYGNPVELPFLPTVNGSLSTDLEIHLSPNVSEISISLECGIDLKGSGSSLHSFHIPGSDDPVTLTTYNITWGTDHKFADGSWMSSGDIEARYNASYSDLGLHVGQDGDDIIYNGGGGDIAMDSDGGTATVMISPKVGSISKILYEKGEDELEVYSNNTYVSAPGLSFGADGTAVVVWSEASYDEEMVNRASSLRLKYGMLTPDGDGSFNVDSMLNTSAMDHQPDIASSPVNGKSAVVWIRDMDSDPRTLNDTEVAVSFLGAGGWSAPEFLTDDGLVDSDPSIRFSESGDLWVVWRTGNSSIRYSMKERGGAWSDPGYVQLPPDIQVIDLSLGMGHDDEPLLSYCIRDGTGASYLCTRSANPSRESDWDVNRTLIRTMNWLEEVQTFTNSKGSTTYVWREHGPEAGDLAAMVVVPSEGVYSKPITLTDDLNLEKGTKHAPVEDGMYMFSFSTIPGPGGSEALIDERQFHTLNMSWGAEIERASTDPDVGYSPGSILKLTVSLEYTGLTAPGSTRVDVYRRYLDRSSSEVKEEFWASSIKEFDRIAARGQIEFTVTVKEYQLGFSVHSLVPSGIGPQYISSSYIPLPSIPDPEISGLEVKGTEGEVRFAVEVRNWGNVPIGGWELRLVGNNGSSTLSFPDKMFEPLFRRDRVDGSVLNSTVVDLGPGSSATFHMNMTPGASVEYVWAEMISSGWQPNVRSFDEILLVNSCGVEISPKDERVYCGVGEHILIENELSISQKCLNNSKASPASYSVRQQFIDRSGTVIWQNRTSVNLTSSPIILDFHLNGSDVGPGHYLIRTTVTPTLQDPEHGIDTFYGTSHCIVRSPPDLMIKEMFEDKNGSVRGIKVSLNNSSPYTADIFHITLYNGLPRDDVVISENMGLSLAGGDEVLVLLPEDLPEGTYLLSAVVRVPDPDRPGGEVIWKEVDGMVREMEITRTAQTSHDQEEEMDWDDISNTMIFSVSAVLIVLLISSLFYKRKGRGKGED